MNAPRSSSLVVVVILILLIAQACVPTANLTAVNAPAPESATPTELFSINATLRTPTPEIIANGQIAFIMDGNVWRYILSTGESIQVTSQDWDGRWDTSYMLPRLSPDGRYVAYISYKGSFNESYITDLVNGTIIDLPRWSDFIGWTGQGYEFFAKLGIKDFKIYRYDLNDLSSPVLLATFKGFGTVYEVSSDGQWASISRYDLGPDYFRQDSTDEYWHLPTSRKIELPINLAGGSISYSPGGSIEYSPDSKQVALTKARWIEVLDEEKPLYVANIDLSNLTLIFNEPQTEVDYQLWSPDGQWLSFEARTIEPADNRVMLVRPDGSDLRVVADGDARLDGLGWSPDGSKLLYWAGEYFPENIFSYELSTGLKQQIPLVVPINSSDRWFDWGNLPQ